MDMKLWAISPTTLMASEAIDPNASRMNENSKLINPNASRMNENSKLIITFLIIPTLPSKVHL